MNQSPEQTAIHTIRTLAMDAVQQARSGHPGTAMAMAPVVYTIATARKRFQVLLGRAAIANAKMAYQDTRSWSAANVGAVW